MSEKPEQEEPRFSEDDVEEILRLWGSDGCLASEFGAMLRALPKPATNPAPNPTRAVEVAPGIFIAPDDYQGPVQLVAGLGPGLTRKGVYLSLKTHEGERWVPDVAAADVAAKLWPREERHASVVRDLRKAKELSESLRKWTRTAVHIEEPRWGQLCDGQTELTNRIDDAIRVIEGGK